MTDDRGIPASGAGVLTDREAFHALSGSNVALVLTDPALNDNPIVYANRAFERVTGYAAAAALGRNCRFLQGPGTDPEDVARIRDAVAREAETTVDLLNYRADGTTFLNRLILAPIRGEDGGLRYFLGIQKPLTAEEARHSVNADLHLLRELQHRVKNHMAMISSLIRIEARAGHAPETAGRIIALSQRVDSLQALYHELSDARLGRAQQGVSLGAYLARLTGALNAFDGRSGVRINLCVAELRLDTDVAARVGLIVSEIVTNALKHAYPDQDAGCIDLTACLRDDGALVIEIADDGIGIPQTIQWPARESVGGRVVMGLTTELKAQLAVDRTGPGTRVVLTVPDVLGQG